MVIIITVPGIRNVPTVTGSYFIVDKKNLQIKVTKVTLQIIIFFIQNSNIMQSNASKFHRINFIEIASLILLITSV